MAWRKFWSTLSRKLAEFIGQCSLGSAVVVNDCRVAKPTPRGVSAARVQSDTPDTISAGRPKS